MNLTLVILGIAIVVACIVGWVSASMKEATYDNVVDLDQHHP